MKGREVHEQRPVWSLNLCKIKGISLSGHLSLILFLAWLAYEHFSAGSSLLGEVLFISLYFLSLLIHELGHSIARRKREDALSEGIVVSELCSSTKSIVLFPFGSRLKITGRKQSLSGEEHCVSEEKHAERSAFYIALGGPAANALVASLVYPFMMGGGSIDALSWERGAGLEQFFVMNVFLAVINLIPGVPFDGAYFHRSVFRHLSFSKLIPSETRLGQLLSLIFLAAAVPLMNVPLMIVFFTTFVIGLKSELYERARLAALHYNAQDIMTEAKDIQVFRHGMALSDALPVILRSFQRQFPVLHENSLMGVVERDDILRSAASLENCYLSDLMNREVSTISCNTPLLEILEIMNHFSTGFCIVQENGEFMGMVRRDTLHEFLFIQGAKNKAGSNPSAMNKRI